jgi:hypothetical protein
MYFNEFKHSFFYADLSNKEKTALCIIDNMFGSETLMNCAKIHREESRILDFIYKYYEKIAVIPTRDLKAYLDIFEYDDDEVDLFFKLYRICENKFQMKLIDDYKIPYLRASGVVLDKLEKEVK